jgi:hypothetical protein
MNNVLFHPEAYSSGNDFTEDVLGHYPKPTRLAKRNDFSDYQPSSPAAFEAPQRGPF